MLKNFVYFMLFLLPAVGFANGLQLHENKGQWEANVLFKAKLNNGAFFVEKNKLTFVLHNAQDLDEFQSKIHGHGEEQHDHNSSLHQSHNSSRQITHNSNSQIIQSHAFSIVFSNANDNSQSEGNLKSPTHFNYFLGKDENKWRSNVASYQELYITGLYDNIDFRLYGKDDNLKYEFILHPGADASVIQMKYEGVNITLALQKVLIKTAAGTLIDEQAVSFYKNVTDTISTLFKVENNVVSFDLENYDKSKELIIDPVLNFATFTGATTDNWGFTATNDAAGNAYAGGVVFGTGYPVTLGAFQSSYAGGTYDPNWGIDISISKFSADGNLLLYSTYLGGEQQETPHSLIVNANNELIVFGTTSSRNYPTTAGAFDSNFKGGDTVLVDNVLMYHGVDIIVSKFSSNGSALLGSTYFGGSENDGFNDESETSGLYHNYSDIFRGEVITDVNDNIYIATSTASNDIPIVNGFQTNNAGGSQDGFLVKFNSDLSQVIWSSYLGGTASDAVYGLQANSAEELYVTGGTTSANFPISGGFQNSYAGAIDGFVAKISNDGSALLSSSYIGTNAYDQGYFIQIDTSDFVYVYGQTSGNMPISGGTYNNPGSGQFIHKYSPDLSNLEVATVVGSGSGGTDIVPSAFLVNNCGNVYIAGWGGGANQGYGDGSTFGMPTSSDAQQTVTDGSDFYLMVLNQDFSGLSYATFFGSNTAAEHVDGGTSRFDKNGIVYQAVCAACGATTAFPTTPGAYSETMNSPNCNLAVFKFDVSKIEATIHPNVDSLVCKGDSIHFTHQSSGGSVFEWVFHDGTTSVQPDVYKAFDTAGVYEVQLIVRDPLNCSEADTTRMTFRVQELHVPQISFTDTTVCFGDPIFIDLGDTENYNLLINGQLSGSFTQSTTIVADSTVSYLLTSTTVQCPDSIGLDVYVNPIPASVSYTADLCENQTIGFPIPTDTANQYSWTPNTPNIVSDTAYFLPADSTIYQLEITTSCGVVVQEFNIGVTTIPMTISPDSTVCMGDTLPLFVTGGDTYNWSPAVNGVVTNDSPQFIADTTTLFVVAVTKNNCVKQDSVRIQVLPARPQPNSFTTDVCNGEQAVLAFQTQPDFTYNWSPSSGFTIVNDSVVFTPTDTLNYVLTITGACGIAEVNYQLNTTTIAIDKSPDTTVCAGTALPLFVGGGDSYIWSPAVNGTQTTGSTATFNADTTTLFLVDVSKNNCVKQDSILVNLLPNSPVPNSYTTDVCNGEQAVLPFQTQPDFTYNWSPSSGFSIVNDSVVFAPTDTLNYVLTIVGTCGVATVNYQLNTTTIDIVKSPDTTVCRGDVVPLFVGGGDSYNWSPAVNGTQTTGSNVNFTADVTTTFQLAVQKDNCTFNDSIQTTVLAARPVGANYSAPICDYEVASLPFPVQSDFSYLWRPSTGVNVNGNEVTLSPSTSTVYTLIVTGECGVDSIKYDVPVTEIIDSAARNYTACIGDVVQLFAGGGDSYVWSPDEELTGATTGTPEFEVKEDEVFTVDIIKGNCTKTRQINLTTFNKKPQTANKEYTINYGETQQFPLLNEYNYSWSPSTYLSCADCSNPVSAPEEDMTYYFTYTDENNCSITDSLRINVIFDLYVPNAFTPEGGGINEVFYAYSHAVKEFQMDVFNRWGEKIFTSNDINVGWDGTYKGRLVQQDVYVWEIHYVKVHTNRVINKVGTVTLIR